MFHLRIHPPYLSATSLEQNRDPTASLQCVQIVFKSTGPDLKTGRLRFFDHFHCGTRLYL